MAKISDLVLYKDHHLIAINKPAGLPSQQDKSGEKNAHQMMMAYAHRDLYLVHRLDQRVSGVLLFAKTKIAAASLSGQWSLPSTEKIYYAIVPLANISEQQILKHYLSYNTQSNFSIAYTEKLERSNECQLEYTIVQRLENYMVLRIRLITGRKHQIRAQLAAIGIPVRGDIKYGSRRTNEDGSIDLHAYSLRFIHPSGGKAMLIKAPLPSTGLWPHVIIEE